MNHGWLGAAATTIAMFIASSAVADSSGKTFAFLVTDLRIANYETKFWDECPEGLNPSPADLWFRGLSQRDKGVLTKNGTLNRQDNSMAYRRGPHGEDHCWNPELFNDPPLRVVQSKFGYGFDLDGDKEGQGSASTCPHPNMEDPVSGQAGIDNQLGRIMGCIRGYRKSSSRNIDYDANHERLSTGKGLILVELSGVDNVRNDPDISVRFFRALSAPQRDAQGNAVPFASYKVDVDVDGQPRYGAVVKGQITDGKLTTAPGDVDLPYYGSETFSEISLRGMNLALTLAPDGMAFEGLMGGYYDSQKWYAHARDRQFLNSGEIICPALFHAVREHADGYRDPVTGKCTALSSAFELKGIAAFIVNLGSNLASNERAGR
jgi:hypothetical protein